MAKRPRTLNREHDKPIIVALHGAGVEADSEFWINSLPPQRSSWVRTKLRVVISLNSNNQFLLPGYFSYRKDAMVI